ncbi:MAG: hypothetical protein ACTSRC_22035 [Candidatus Helarchaeota archaeon]
MKKQTYIVFLIELLFFGFFIPERTLADNGLNLGGYLQTDNRVRLKDNNDFSWQEYRLDMKAELKPSEKAHFYSDIWLRSWGIPDVQNSLDLGNKDKVAPWNLDVREAYVDLYGFLTDDLDIRIGRQRIAWGTGDKLNPTDNLNPDDLEDIWDFGRHLGSDGLKASYYFGDYTFTGVFIPTFTPAVLPRGDWASALSPSMDLPAGLTLRNLTDTIVMPANNPQESSVIGFKVSSSLLDYDYSLSYVRTKDDLPLARKVTFNPADASSEVDIASEFIYPEMDIVGIDMAGALGDVGIWGEAAMFFPEKIEMTTDLSALEMGVQESTSLDDEPYIKYVMGADYTFKNGIYINGQYLHGFIHERGKDNLEDYFMCGMEWKSNDDKLKITPLGGGLEIKDFKDIEKNYALIYSPEIAYYPVDNAEITLGGLLIEGKSSTTFGRVRNNDEMYLKVKYSF